MNYYGLRESKNMYSTHGKCVKSRVVSWMLHSVSMYESQVDIIGIAMERDLSAKSEKILIELINIVVKKLDKVVKI